MNAAPAVTTTQGPEVPDHPDDYKWCDRTYHGYRRGLYMCPCDEDEKDRLDVMHKIIYVSARGNELHRAPLTRTGPEGEFPALRILDLGCGTGIWAMDMADLYRDAEVVGIDLSLIQPSVVAPNLRFQRKDFESPWIMGEDSWDLIHLGMLCGSVVDWTDLYHKIWYHLKPGFGYIEQVEMDFEPRCDDGSLPLASPWREWYNEYLIDATERRDRPIAYNHNTPQLLRNNGFVDVEQIKIRIPVGEWQRLGCSLEPLSLAPFIRVHKWQEHDVKGYCEEVDKDVRDVEIHAYNDLYIITARKPGTIEPPVRAGL